MGLGGRVLGAVFLLSAAGLAVAAVVAAPYVLKRARPLVREGLKRGMNLYEGARASAVEFAEDVEDLVAEVKADLTAKSGLTPTGEDSSVAR
jgi:hypothetical protein